MTMTEAEWRDRLQKKLPKGCTALLRLDGNLAVLGISRNGVTRRIPVPTRHLDSHPDLTLEEAMEFLLQRLDLQMVRGEDEWPTMVVKRITFRRDS